jgi:hypothetical protein
MRRLEIDAGAAIEAAGCADNAMQLLRRPVGMRILLLVQARRMPVTLPTFGKPTPTALVNNTEKTSDRSLVRGPLQITMKKQCRFSPASAVDRLEQGLKNGAAAAVLVAVRRRLIRDGKANPSRSF